MHEQNQIGSTLASADGTAQLKDLLAQAGSVSRTEVGRRVCELFGFHDALGRPQLAGCMKALRRLEADQRIELPAPRHARPLPAGRAVSDGRSRSRRACPSGSIWCRHWQWSR